MPSPIPGGAARREEPLTSSFHSFPTMTMGMRLGQQQWEGCSSPAHGSGYSPISSPGQWCQHMPVSVGTCVWGQAIPNCGSAGALTTAPVTHRDVSNSGFGHTANSPR